VDLHPPQEAVEAFRDVSSAREDKETNIHRAWAILAQEVPRARGRAAVEIARAQAQADAAATVAAGQAEAFVAQAGIYGPYREVLGDVLRFENAERVLAGPEKVIAPPGSAGRNMTLWKDRPPLPPLGEK
jgi:membrane protease subunit HflK